MMNTTCPDIGLTGNSSGLIYTNVSQELCVPLNSRNLAILISPVVGVCLTIYNLMLSLIAVVSIITGVVQIMHLVQL